MAMAPGMAAPDDAAPMDDAAPAPDMGDEGDMGGGGETVLVTITKAADGGYMVYAGDESEGAEEAPEMGAEAGGAAGKPADTIGAALKAALDIMTEDAGSQGEEGSSEDQLAAGFNADQNPTPARPKLKYPPMAAA